jgi:hypothetical protein
MTHTLDQQAAKTSSYLIESGIHSHSSHDNGYIIFSVFQYKEMDIINHNRVVQVLTDNNISFKQLEGMLEGKWEMSILIERTHQTLAEALCWEHKQECYLMITQHKHGVRKATMCYPEGTRKDIGYFMSVPEELATQQDGWTYSPSDDKYWAITPTDDTMGTYVGLSPLRRRACDTM